MKKIPLTQGRFALVDDEDFEELNKFKWHYAQYGRSGYAKRMIWNKETKKSKIVRMHHFILPLKEGLMVDHINRNGIDNRKCNLRLVTKAQNMMNKFAPKNNKSGFKGVSWLARNRKWRAYINFNYKQIHLGLFEDKKDAAREWNKAAISLFGEYAYLNNI